MGSGGEGLDGTTLVASEKLSKELSNLFLDTVGDLAPVWDSMGLSEKEKMRTIKRIAKDTMSALQTNKLSEEDRRISLIDSIQKMEETKKSVLVSLQELDPSPPNSDNGSTSLMSKNLKLKRELGKLNKLKAERLDAVAPLIKAYDKVVGKLTHMKAAGVGEDATFKEYPVLRPENYVSKAGAGALKDLILKREEELKSLEEEEKKLEAENEKLMEDLGLGVNELDPPPQLNREECYPQGTEAIKGGQAKGPWRHNREALERARYTKRGESSLPSQGQSDGDQGRVPNSRT